jgi:replication-associated recombination protein RarA
MGGEDQMSKVELPPDPWQRTTTAHGFAADEVISALQKSIRRGLIDNALLLGWEMYATSPELEDMLWSRLCVISVEDVGLGNPSAPVLAESLFRMHGRYPRPQHDRFLFAAHLIRVLATSTKDRTSDDMANLAKHSVLLGERLPDVPDFALDMHTRRGQEMGRDYRYFVEEASKVMPEVEGREEKYRRWLLDAIDAGKLS